MKKLFQVLVALIGILAIGALVLSFSIDGIVKSSIRDTTSEMLDTSVDVDDVAISILDGTGTIKGITIHNPEGFSDNPAVKLQQIKLKVDLYSLLSDTVIVKRIEIKKPEIYFEQNNAQNNLKTLSDRLGGSSSTETNLIVDYLLVQDGLVRVDANIAGKEESAKAKFDRIELEGIGRKGNNTMEQTMRQILEPILEKAAQEAVKEGLLDKAKEELKKLLDGN